MKGKGKADILPYLNQAMSTIVVDSSNALKLLSSMYLCKPSREVIDNWKALLAEDDAVFMLDLKKAVNEIDTASEQKLEDLLWEYTRLFIGPYKLPCPPWESVYTSSKRLMMQDAYDEVIKLYGELGLEINDTNIMPDHIGAELNFLSVLFQEMGEESGRKADSISIAGRFLNEHLMKWIPQFCRDMEDASDSFFYKALARTTLDLLDLIGG